MYQELQIFEESFEHPVWGTEDNDLPLPTLAVGDLFEHDSLPGIHWRTPPEPGQVFKVVAIKHVFRETGSGPEADHLLKVSRSAGAARAMGRGFSEVLCLEPVGARGIYLYRLMGSRRRALESRKHEAVPAAGRNRATGCRVHPDRQHGVPGLGLLLQPVDAARWPDRCLAAGRSP